MRAWLNAKQVRHEPRLLQNARALRPVLAAGDVDAVLAGTAGWKTARFGPLGKAATELRRQRLAAATAMQPQARSQPVYGGVAASDGYARAQAERRYAVGGGSDYASSYYDYGGYPPPPAPAPAQLPSYQPTFGYAPYAGSYYENSGAAHAGHRGNDALAAYYGGGGGGGGFVENATGSGLVEFGHAPASAMSSYYQPPQLQQPSQHMRFDAGGNQLPPAGDYRAYYSGGGGGAYNAYGAAQQQQQQQQDESASYYGYPSQTQPYRHYYQ